MSNTTFPALCALALAMTLSACEGGQGSNDTLVDGAVDRPAGETSRAAAEDVGPPSMSSTAAGPGAARPGADGQPAGAASSAATPAATLALSAQGAHGAHLTDSAGMALYHLEGDRDGSKCTGECVQAWPPVLMQGTQPSGAAGLQGGMIATIARPDRTQQVTYNGMPLYRYAADGGAGATNGHGVKDKFGTWHLVSAQGTPLGSGAEHAGH